MSDTEDAPPSVASVVRRAGGTGGFFQRGRNRDGDPSHSSDTQQGSRERYSRGTRGDPGNTGRERVFPRDRAFGHDDRFRGGSQWRGGKARETASGFDGMDWKHDMFEQVKDKPPSPPPHRRNSLGGRRGGGYNDSSLGPKDASSRFDRSRLSRRDADDLSAAADRTSRKDERISVASRIDRRLNPDGDSRPEKHDLRSDLNVTDTDGSRRGDRDKTATQRSARRSRSRSVDRSVHLRLGKHRSPSPSTGRRSYSATERTRDRKDGSDGSDDNADDGDSDDDKRSGKGRKW